MEYLKVTDIMVGDIVRYADQDKPQIATNDTLHAIKEGAKVVGVELTAEILQKKGLVDYGDDIYQDDKRQWGVDFRNHEFYTFNEEVENTIKPILFFHELQHALRVVGLKYDFKPCLQ